jgi:copper chaperone CopZ
VRVALKSVNGVDSVDVSLNKGLATVTLKDGNTVTIKQLQAAIVRNGYSTKQSLVTAIGQLSFR